MANGELKIESGVPIPPPLGKAADPYSKSGALRRLEVGESVVLPGNPESAGTLVWNIAKQTGRKFTCRKVDDNHMRVWRIK